MTKRTAIAVGLAIILVAATMGAEATARSAIASRLPDAYDARFTGQSALVALATDATELTLTVDPEVLQDALTDKLGTKAAERATLVLADGTLGIETTVRSRQLVAWFTLDASDGRLMATPVSVDVGGFQLAPDLLFGGEPIELPNPLDNRCGVPIDDATVAADGLHLTITIARADAACLKSTERS